MSHPVPDRRLQAPATRRTEARKPASETPASVPDRGAPLSPELRDYFEPRFGADFSAVRVHNGPAAAQSASALQARAYTHGQDVVFGAGQFAPSTSAGRQLLAHELAHVMQQRSGAAPARIQRAADFGAMYKGKDGKVRSHLGQEYDDYKSALGKTESSGDTGGHRFTPIQTITSEELLTVYKGVAKDIDKTQDAEEKKKLKATVDAYVERLNQAFRTFKIDTVEAQASYIANAWRESDQFRFMTETEKAVKSNKPYQSKPENVKLNRSWLNDAAAGKIENVINYETGGSINPVGDWDKSFIGRGPIQVTHRHFYVQALAVMEHRAEELEKDDPASQDAKDLRAAVDAIKADPRQAANPKYAFMFSAAFMKMADDQGVRGDVKASKGQVTSWMGKQPADAKKDKEKAYGEAQKMLMQKWIAQYGYDAPDDPINSGGFGPDDATTRVRPGPVRSTLLRRDSGVQRKAQVGAVDDPLEREADATAEAVLRMPAPDRDAAPLASAQASTSAPRALGAAGAGRPLPPALRGYFEPRFGQDFSGVRVHTDAASTQALQARAYTRGCDVVFAPGEYAPTSARGRQLLAHELAHVVQQRALLPAGAPLQRKKDPAPAKPAKFYQYVIDELAKQEADYARQRKEKQYEFFVHYEMNYKALKALLPLAQAVDEGRTADIPKLVDAFIAADHGPPFRALTQPLLVDLVARLFTLGLDGEGTKLRENYSKGEKQDDWIKRDVGLNARNIAILDAIVDRVGADNSTPEGAQAALTQYLRVLPQLRDELLSVDRTAAQQSETPGFRPAPIAEKTRWEGLLGVLNKLVTAMVASLQALMDRAADELGSGKSEGKARLLAVRDWVEKKILPALSSADGKQTIGDIRIVLASTEIKAGKGVIHDALVKDRKVAVKTYSAGQDSVRNLNAPLDKVFEQRIEQIAVMARIYGTSELLRADKPAEKERIEDAKANAEAMKQTLAGGKLRLDSDDDWRGFVLQKYKSMTGAGGKTKAQALSAVIALLYDYLQAFTIHARFTDIYDQGDFKDAYFNKPFPKTLSGQMVHDCGVYAMRAAYILSLVREELGLRFRFIRMPAHVGLIITGEGLPMYIAHNNSFSEFAPDKIAALKQGWDADNAKDPPDKAKGKEPKTTDEEQFVAELAAVEDIEGPLDQSVRVSEVPKPGKTVDSTQRALWTEYKKVASQDVFGAASADKNSRNFQFHTRYLAFTERFREWRNGAVLPFWNDKAPKSWAELEKALKAGNRTELKGSELAPLLEAHLKTYDEALKPVQTWREGIDANERAIGQELRADPRLPAKDVRITRGGRFEYTHSWEDYRARVEALRADAAASPDKKYKVSEVLDPGLKPPFVPVEEKAMAPLE